MKRLLKRILLLLCGVLMLGIPAGAVFLVGQASKPDQTQEELRAALNSGKLVMVAFYSKNCKYCKADEQVLMELEVNQDIMIIVRVDVGSQFGKQLAQQVGVRGVPAYFIIDSVTGDLIYQQEGSLQLARMYEAITEWIEGKGAE